MKGGWGRSIVRRSAMSMALVRVGTHIVNIEHVADAKWESRIEGSDNGGAE